MSEEIYDIEDDGRLVVSENAPEYAKELEDEEPKVFYAFVKFDLAATLAEHNFGDVDEAHVLEAKDLAENYREKAVEAIEEDDDEALRYKEAAKLFEEAYEQYSEALFDDE